MAGLPRWVQGIGLKCIECKGMFQSFVYNYVLTLAPHLRKELDALIVPFGNGVNMSLVQSIRIDTNAADLEKTSRANIYDEYCT